ncbi:MAG: hypothetical protein HYS25_00515 [Ignavibacteriales bacterium]|nr:hypothetical protein [Ignavibacteriales bacterium]
MKKLFYKYFLLIEIFVVSSLFPQDRLSIQFDYANKLFQTSQYFDAITEYKRLLFFDEAKKYSYKAYFQIGKCYKAGAKFDEAIKYFSTASINAANENEKLSVYFEIVRTNISRRTTSRALQILDEIEKENTNTFIRDSINYWRGWTYIFADDWKNAADAFSKIKSDHELKKLCEQVEKEKVSVTFTKAISYFLPGAGEVYSGNILSGSITFGWNLLFGYLTINSFAEERIFDGMVIGSLGWLRFYRGNIQSAEESAKQKNIAIANKILKYLQYEYKGAKP